MCFGGSTCPRSVALLPPVAYARSYSLRLCTPVPHIFEGGGPHAVFLAGVGGRLLVATFLRRCTPQPVVAALPGLRSMHPETTYAEVLLLSARTHGAPRRHTPRLRLCWAGAYAGPEDGVAATISVREQYAIHARASKLLLQKHATANGTPKFNLI